MKNKSLKILIPAILFIILIFGWIFIFHRKTPVDLWSIRSIDTMKYSRDSAGNALYDMAFDKEIEKQVSVIANSGANYVAIATPYDPEFVPVIKRWVASARQHKLKVWFRGNFSGWEGWFNYPKISRETHLKLLGEFIKNNPDLFEVGDIFTPCPECENGGPGDPRATKDITGYRDFLKKEFDTSVESFRNINKPVQVGYFSMNYDVANLIMDKNTTVQLGGVVTIDHYVKSPDELLKDIQIIHEKSGGQVVLGEFGAPIPDIHGNQTPQEQADWINQALEKISHEDYLIGINYWTSFGGSTAIWDGDGNPFPAVAVIQRFFTTKVYKTQQ